MPLHFGNLDREKSTWNFTKFHQEDKCWAYFVDPSNQAEKKTKNMLYRFPKLCDTIQDRAEFVILGFQDEET